MPVDENILRTYINIKQQRTRSMFIVPILPVGILYIRILSVVFIKIAIYLVVRKFHLHGVYRCPSWRFLRVFQIMPGEKKMITNGHLWRRLRNSFKIVWCNLHSKIQRFLCSLPDFLETSYSHRSKMGRDTLQHAARRRTCCRRGMDYTIQSNENCQRGTLRNPTKPFERIENFGQMVRVNLLCLFKFQFEGKGVSFPTVTK